ncbi:MAG: DUF885 domain-containing protein [Gammaproteobacteria bacterium]|nr:DUF885 domain-containing protein [Gammaproteobacteria bacterium]MDH5304049.1 DUF885 domain-containing protein [Gammaproteobacteria bacterium]MDH5321694.1 DUF885 domain-containing protein [Gammaproteobacteria bacterium]
MRKITSAYIAGLLLAIACTTELPDEQGIDTPAAFAALLEEHFEQHLALNPIDATEIGDYRYNDQYANSIGPEHRASEHELNSEFLARLADIERDDLGVNERLSYDMFKLRLETALAGERFPDHLAPMNQFRSASTSFVLLGSGSGDHPFDTVKHYDDFLARIDGFVVYTEQAIENMREGVRQGITQPRILMQKFLPQVESQLVDRAEASGFYAPITNMPESFSAADRARLTAAYKDAIENKLIPAYARIKNFMVDEYLSAARDSIGLLDLPDGEAWYAYKVRQITTTDLTPAEIHQIGLDEVARIHNEMRGVMQQVGFEGELSEFFEYVNSDARFFYSEPEQLIQAYRDMTAHIESLVPKLFEVFPKTPFEVRRVEPFREQSAAKGSYQSGLPDGSRPGIFYANAYNVGTRPKWDMQSLFLHEAIPGHHFQIALQQENESLPRFRRYGGFTAYIEGWGLYAESLGRELGVYTDPLDYFGALNAELWRSIRLVTDTGIHAKGWTRQQVLDYMFANSATSETRAVAEAERFMAIPGQALAYKIGMLKIREIRARAEAQLGDKFDVRAFHTQVLMDGAMPLSMLETKIQTWVDAQM